MAKKSNTAVDSANLSKAIRMCMDSGKVELGGRMAIREALLGHGKLIVIAANAPKEEAADLARYCQLSNMPLLQFTGTSIELGSVCGKPFPVSALWVSDVGNSPILTLVPKA